MSRGQIILGQRCIYNLFLLTAIGVGIGAGGGGGAVMVTASVMILVLCLIRMKKHKRSTQQSGLCSFTDPLVTPNAVYGIVVMSVP